MPVSVNTVYTKERLLRFNNYVMASKKLTWILFGICTLWVAACFIVLAALGLTDSTVTLCMVLLLVMDITYVLCAFVLPRFTLGKSKSLNTEVRYTFGDDSFELCAVNQYANETSVVRYTAIAKVGKKDTDLYLFISRQQGYIVDLSALPDEQETLLRRLLASKIPDKKFKWKDQQVESV
jgi:hypothetical protein